MEVNLPHPFAAPLRFEWTPSRRLDRLRGNPRVFVHLLGNDRKLLRTFDHPLPEDWNPERPQSYEIDLYQSAVADPLPPGAYELTFGLYDDSGGERWPLATQGQEVGKREYRLGTVVVPATPPATPTFGFAGAWLPVEPGPSRQVVARRCLTGDAAIVAGGFPRRGTVRLAATLERGQAPVEVTASCATERIEVDGPEFHWVGFAVEAHATAQPCEIRFRPSRADGKRSLCVEVLAWRPERG